MKKLITCILLLAFTIAVNTVNAQLQICYKLEDGRDTCIFNDSYNNIESLGLNDMVELLRKQPKQSNPKADSLEKVLRALLAKVDISIGINNDKTKMLIVKDKITHKPIHSISFTKNNSGGLSINHKIDNSKKINWKSHTVSIDKNNIQKITKTVLDQFSFQLKE
jgi:hypothetical protein